MAYMVEGRGPYPNKVGEYCGNHSPGSLSITGLGESRESADKRQKVYLARMRFGRPRLTSEFTAKQLEAKGWVGLYLNESRRLSSEETECLTPLELLEPAEANDTQNMRNLTPPTHRR